MVKDLAQETIQLFVLDDAYWGRIAVKLNCRRKRTIYEEGKKEKENI